MTNLLHYAEIVRSYTNQLIKACETGDESTVAQVLASKQVTLGRVEDGPMTALITAVKNNHLNVVNMLLRAIVDRNLSAGGLDVNSTTQLLSTALLHAKTTAVAHVLLSAGADIQYANMLGYSALSFAVMHSRPDIVSALLAEGASPLLTDAQGKDLVMLSAPTSVHLMALVLSAIISTALAHPEGPNGSKTSSSGAAKLTAPGQLKPAAPIAISELATDLRSLNSADLASLQNLLEKLTISSAGAGHSAAAGSDHHQASPVNATVYLNRRMASIGRRALRALWSRKDAVCGRSALHFAVLGGQSSCVALLLNLGWPLVADLDGNTPQDAAELTQKQLMEVLDTLLHPHLPFFDVGVRRAAAPLTLFEGESVESEGLRLVTNCMRAMSASKSPVPSIRTSVSPAFASKVPGHVHRQSGSVHGVILRERTARGAGHHPPGPLGSGEDLTDDGVRAPDWLSPYSTRVLGHSNPSTRTVRLLKLLPVPLEDLSERLEYVVEQLHEYDHCENLLCDAEAEAEQAALEAYKALTANKKADSRARANQLSKKSASRSLHHDKEESSVPLRTNSGSSHKKQQQRKEKGNGAKQLNGHLPKKKKGGHEDASKKRSTGGPKLDANRKNRAEVDKKSKIQLGDPGHHDDDANRSSQSSQSSDSVPSDDHGYVTQQRSVGVEKKSKVTADTLSKPLVTKHLDDLVGEDDGDWTTVTSKGKVANKDRDGRRKIRTAGGDVHNGASAYKPIPAKRSAGVRSELRSLSPAVSANVHAPPVSSESPVKVSHHQHRHKDPGTPWSKAVKVGAETSTDPSGSNHAPAAGQHADKSAPPPSLGKRGKDDNSQSSHGSRRGPASSTHVPSLEERPLQHSSHEYQYRGMPVNRVGQFVAGPSPNQQYSVLGPSYRVPGPPYYTLPNQQVLAPNVAYQYYPDAFYGELVRNFREVCLEADAMALTPVNMLGGRLEELSAGQLEALSASLVRVRAKVEYAKLESARRLKEDAISTQTKLEIDREREKMRSLVIGQIELEPNDLQSVENIVSMPS